MRVSLLLGIGCLCFIASCSATKQRPSSYSTSLSASQCVVMGNTTSSQSQWTSIEWEPDVDYIISPHIELEKALLYDRYTLQDHYQYRNISRLFQWKIIEHYLMRLDYFKQQHTSLVTLHNYKNRNGLPSVPEQHLINQYREITDQSGVARYAAIPLYRSTDFEVLPVRYALDGQLAALLSSTNIVAQVRLFGEYDTYYTPIRYMKVVLLFDGADKYIFIDKQNQNILTVEKFGTSWLIRSMNPVTTGAKAPPLKKETPSGVFVLQEKKPRMFYTKPHSREIMGFAAYATRFSSGAYIHGFPTDYPRTTPIEYRATLGTMPRSRMCVRTATSHAKFIYDWVKPLNTIVVVF